MVQSIRRFANEIYLNWRYFICVWDVVSVDTTIDHTQVKYSTKSDYQTMKAQRFI